MEKISLFDLTGRVVIVKEVKSTSVTVKVSTLRKGVYILKVASDGKIFYQRLVVQ